MRENCLIFLLFHCLTRLASAWQVRAAALWMPFINFLIWKEVQANFWVMVKACMGTICPQAHPRGRSLLSQTSYLQMNMPRAFWPTSLLPFTEGEIRNPVMLNHSKPFKTFLCPSEPKGFQETDSIHLLHLRGPATKIISHEVSPWIWDCVLCITCLFCVLFLTHFHCSDYSWFCWWDCYFY